MKRRDFITLIGSAAATAATSLPLAAFAQRTGSGPRIGYLYPGPEAMAAARIPYFLDGLRSLGFREPDQVTLVTRATGGDPARVAPLLAELLASNIDVLAPVGRALVHAAHAATTSVPIVALDLESVPIESGLLASLSHPGGNLTGVFFDFPDFSMKWLELLREIIPGLGSIIVLWDPATPVAQTEAIAAAARLLGVKVEIMQIRTPAEFEAVFSAIDARRPDGLLLPTSPVFGPYAKQLADQTVKHRLATVSFFPEFARAGGLTTYGPNLLDMYRDQGVMVAKVLKGAKPAELPAQRPTRFELIVNLQTAKALNLTIPTSVLLRADEVIE